MQNDVQRHGVALALLAVLVGAIVQVTQGKDPFTLWQSMVGSIMILTAHAYDKEIATRWGSEAIAFAMIVAAGIVFVLGVFLDRIFLWSGIVHWGDANREKLISLPGYISFNLHDDLYFILWLLLTAAVFWLRHQPSSSVPPASS
jgi:hypothetical protein